MATKIFSFFIFLALLSPLFGATKEVRSEGVGQNRSEAIYNGLIEAIGQVKGLELASRVKTKFSHRDFAISSSDGDEHMSKGSSEVKKDIYSSTEGVIKSYKILSSKRLKYEYRVKLLVSIPVYKTVGGDDKRRRMVIIPFENSQRGSELSTFLTDEIAKTRRFALLDRENLDLYQREKNLLLSDNVTIEEKAKIGKLLGTDYMIIGSFVKNNFKQTGTKIIGNQKTTYSTVVNYKVILAPTMQIKYSNSIEAVTAEEASKKIADDIINNIYPILVVEARGEIVLNQGSLKVGDIYDIYKRGKKLIDPYTKKSLGYSESKIGELQVVRSTAKLSYAKLLSGYAKKHSIARKKSETVEVIAPDGGRETSVIVDEAGGGVVLPFD